MRDSLWRKLISRKFGENLGGWSSRNVRGGYRTSCWKEIRKEWETLVPNVRFLVENGRSGVNFWMDCEIPSCPSRHESYP